MTVHIISSIRIDMGLSSLSSSLSISPALSSSLSPSSSLSIYFPSSISLPLYLPLILSPSSSLTLILFLSLQLSHGSSSGFLLSCCVSITPFNPRDRL